MDTRNKTNTEFRNEVNEILARHESNFDRIHASLQTVLAELQAIRASQNPTSNSSDTNPFAPGESSHHMVRQGASSSRTNHSSSTTTNHNNHHLKLSFPKFGGEDPTGWIFKAEQYFDFKSVAGDQQVQLASFHLEGIALQWHRWLAKFKGLLSWAEFTQAILLRFGPTAYDDPSEALSQLKQVSSVAIYQEEFERLSHRVDGLPEGFLIGCFIAGLRDDIRLDV